VAQIAREKAGIINPNIPVVTTAADPAALEVISQTARARQAPLSLVAGEDSEIRDYQIGLSGGHQRTNAALALAVARVAVGFCAGFFMSSRSIHTPIPCPGVNRKKRGLD